MEILNRIIEQEGKAAEVKAQAAEQARELMTESEHKTEAEVKKRAADFRQERARTSELARQEAEREAQAIIAEAAERDEHLAERVNSSIPDVALAIAKEVAGL